MRKFWFLERPRPSPETARTAGSCVSAEGHMTPAVSPALRPPAASLPKPCPKSGQIRLENPRWGRDSALPRRRAHSASQAAAKGDSPAAGDGALRQEYPEVFRRARHQMLAHHLAALKQPECGDLIAEFKFRTALFRKGSLLIREVAAVLITEEQCHGVFVYGLTMTGVPLADDVLSLVHHSHGAQVGVFLNDTAQFLHQHLDTHSFLSSAARRCFAFCCSSARSAMSI